MYYGYDGPSCQPGGSIADYRLDYPMKQKSINFYVQDVPMILSEAMMHNTLMFALPKGLPYGVRTRVWSNYYPSVQFLGEMVGYLVPAETGGSIEVLVPYAEFDMKTVPWDDIIA